MDTDFDFEHQSTQNENMPVRMLLYLAAVYESILPEDFLCRAKRFSCPAPRFFMLYNGKEPFPDKKVLRLSDAFPMEGDAKLVVTAYNINYSEQNKILQDHSMGNGESQYPYILATKNRQAPRRKPSKRHPWNQIFLEKRPSMA